MTRTWLAVMSVAGACAAAPLALAHDLLWAEQFGTSGDDLGLGAAPDGAGGVFVGGQTSGQLPGETHFGGDDAFLGRFDADGVQLWLTQFGTAADDNINGISADGEGGLFMAGWTWGSLGGPHQGGRDGWVGRHDADGCVLWHEQIGTSSADWAWKVVRDGTGGVYVTGWTFGDLGAVQAQLGEGDAFLARYDGDGGPIWIRQFGTDAEELCFGIASDGAGGVFVGGVTEGDLEGPQQGLGDAFIAHYDADGNQIDIVQFGTSELERVRDLAADGEGGVFACGFTYGDLDGEGNQGGSDGFVAQFDSSLDLVWVKQVGSPGDEIWFSTLPDGHGGVLIAGQTTGDLGVPNAGIVDAVLARRDERGIVSIDQFGTSGPDAAARLATDEAGGVFVGGVAGGSLFGEFQGGNIDAWIARYGCLADLDGSGTVDVVDLLALLAAWGTDGADLTDDGMTDVQDLLAMLAAWGPCLIVHQ